MEKADEPDHGLPAAVQHEQFVQERQQDSDDRQEHDSHQEGHKAQSKEEVLRQSPHLQDNRKNHILLLVEQSKGCKNFIEGTVPGRGV